MWETMRQSKICLNLSNSSSGETQQIKGRHFEIPMTGALQLSSYADNLIDYYDAYEEIILFDEARECADLIKHYLSDEQERKRVALKAYKKCGSEHTWNVRFWKLFEEIENG